MVSQSLIVECLLSMQKVPGSILGQVYFLVAYCHLLLLQDVLSVVYGAIINWC